MALYEEPYSLLAKHKTVQKMSSVHRLRVSCESLTLVKCSESMESTEQSSVNAMELTLSLLLVFLDDVELVFVDVSFGVPFDVFLVTGVGISGSIFLPPTISCSSSSSSSSLLSSEKLSSSDSLGTKLWSESSSSSSLSMSSPGFRSLLSIEASGMSHGLPWFEYLGWVILCCERLKQ